MEPAVKILVGDAKETLKTLGAGSVQCCVTSPPYFGLRSYLPDGHPDKASEIGLEQTPDAYVASLVEVFREVRRVLADDGVFWLNIGDSYAANRGYQVSDTKHKSHDFGKSNAGRVPPGLKPKDLMMIPARVALALQADGWYLRSHVIWHKPNPMPESVRDRPTSAHESVFLLTKNARYFYDAAAVREAGSTNSHGGQPIEGGLKQAALRQQIGGRMGIPAGNAGRNMRNVWAITPKPYSGAHFATFPPELAERCIKAGSALGDTVLDPFFGAGTTGLVAKQLGRHCIGIELNPEYAGLAEQRIAAGTARRSQPRKMPAPKPAPLGGLFSADDEAVCATLDAKPA